MMDRNDVNKCIDPVAVNREDVLEKAKACVSGDRDKQYGKPEDSFYRIALMWSAYLRTNVTAKDVALMMILFKVAREEYKDKLDNWIDICGYAACGAECGRLDA